MVDQVIKAFVKTEYPDYRLLYSERTVPVADGSTAISSIYKNAKDKTYLAVASLKKNGDYRFFTDNRFHAGIYTEEEIIRVDITESILVKLQMYVLLQRKILTSLSSDKNLPSILSIGNSDNLTFYYLKGGTLAVVSVIEGVLDINLPKNEQRYLSEKLYPLGIFVRNEEDGSGLICTNKLS